MSTITDKLEVEDGNELKDVTKSFCASKNDSQNVSHRITDFSTQFKANIFKSNKSTEISTKVLSL